MKALKKLWSTLDDDRNWAIYVMLAVIILVAVVWLRSSTPIWNPALWPYWIAFALAAVSTVGLILRMEWSRYGYLLIGAMLIFVEARSFYNHGFTLTDVAATIVIVLVIHRFWTMPITHDQQAEPIPNWILGMAASLAETPDAIEDSQIIILLCEPMTLDAQQLAKLARRAYGRRFMVIRDTLEPLEGILLPSARSQPFVACEPPKLLCFCPPFCLTVALHDSPHPAASIWHGESKDQAASHATGAAEAHSPNDWGPAFGHRAAIEISLRWVLTDLGRKDPGYAHTAKLVAELIDDRCLGLYFAKIHQAIPISLQVIEALRSGHPAEALQLVDEAAA